MVAGLFALGCLTETLFRAVEDHLVGHALKHQTGIRMTAVTGEASGYLLNCLVRQKGERWKRHTLF